MSNPFNTTILSTEQPAAKKTFNVDDRLNNRFRNYESTIVTDVIREGWEEWENLEELASLLSNPKIQPFLAGISRESLESPQQPVVVKGRGPNRKRPSQEQLNIIADALLELASKAPETGLSKALLIGGLGDERRQIAEEWWNDVKKAMGDRLETIGHGRSTTFRTKTAKSKHK